MTEQEFLEQLHELNNKINFAKELSFRETLACSDIQDIVDRLKLKVRRFRIYVGGSTGAPRSKYFYYHLVYLLKQGQCKVMRLKMSEVAKEAIFHLQSSV